MIESSWQTRKQLILAAKGNIWGCHSCTAEYSNFLGYRTKYLSTGKWFLAIRRILELSSMGWSSLRYSETSLTTAVIKLLGPEEGGAMIFRNFGVNLPVDMA